MSGPDSTDRTAALHSPAAGGREKEIRLQIATRTDPGLVRANNEDSFVVADLSPPKGESEAPTVEIGVVGAKGILLAVSDGMGGHQAGEVASAIAVRTIREALGEEWSARPERDAVAELRNDLRTSVDRANRAVLAHADEFPEKAGMGATLTAVVILRNLLVLAHVGDSRCYLLRGGFLKTLTNDQSLAEELVKRGIVQRDSPAYAARRSILTRVVGQKGRLEPDSEVAELAQGDRILLCSDGLYGPVDEDSIRAILMEAASPEEGAEELVAEARGCGAPDNVTCIVAWISGPGLPAPGDIDVGGGTLSIALDAKALSALGDSTLAFAQAKAESTGEFTRKDVAGDDTLIGAVAAEAAASLAAEAEKAGSTPPAAAKEAPPNPSPAPAPASPQPGPPSPAAAAPAPPPPAPSPPPAPVPAQAPPAVPPPEGTAAKSGPPIVAILVVAVLVVLVLIVIFR